MSICQKGEPSTSFEVASLENIPYINIGMLYDFYVNNNKFVSAEIKGANNVSDKGVKVDLGIPYDLWDKPSAEVVNMKAKCEYVLENYEEDIEDWYFKYQGDKSLKTFLCEDKVLQGQDASCLKEALPSLDDKSKGDTGNKNKEEL